MRKITQERRDKVRDMVQGGQEVTIEDVGEKLDMNPQSTANLLRDMVRDQELSRTRQGRTAFYGEAQRKIPRRRRTPAAGEGRAGKMAEPMPDVAAAAPEAAMPASAGAGTGQRATLGAVQASFSFEAGRSRLQLALGNTSFDVDRGTADYLWRILGAFLSMPATVVHRSREQAPRSASSGSVTVPESASARTREPSDQAGVGDVIPEATAPETVG